ncbi:hypothetical protein [Hydrogenimonas sp.]
MRFFAIFALMLLFAGCGGPKGGSGLQSPDGKPVDFKPGSIACPECHMDLKGLQDSAELVQDGEVTVFDDPGCMVLWMDKHGIDPQTAKIFVYTRDTKRWIPAQKAHYSQTDPTPMGYGFGAYEKDAKDRIPFEEMRLRVLRGLTLKDPKIRKKLLGY